MKVSQEVYGLLTDKLQDIELRATNGILGGSGVRKSCAEIRELVFDIRQIINNEFHFDDTDGHFPPAA